MQIRIAETRFWDMEVPDEVIKEERLLTYLENGNWPTDTEPDYSIIEAYDEDGEEIDL